MKCSLIERSFKHYYPSDLIHLRGGDANFNTPAHIRDAAIKAIIDGYSHYPPREGIPELREAIAKYYSKYGVDYDPSQILPVPGGGSALHVTDVTFLKPGDEVLVFDPSFSRYFVKPPYLGAKVVPVPLSGSGFHFDPEELKARITKSSKILILCNPNNPTGTVFTRKELEALAEIAIENDLIVVSDEFYSEFVYDNREHVAISSIEGMKERTVVLVGATKCFGFTGWRLASLILPKKYYDMAFTQASYVGLRPATFTQVAGAVAFKAILEPYGKGVMKEWRDEYDRRRKFFCKRMDEIEGISCHMLEGAFYAYPDISSFGIPVEKFIAELKKKEKLEVGNGESHGGVKILGKKSPAYGHIRPALVQDVDILEEAADKIERCIKSM